MQSFISSGRRVAPLTPAEVCFSSGHAVAFSVCGQAAGEPVALPNFSVVYLMVIKESWLNKAWCADLIPCSQYQCPVRSLTTGIEF